MPTPTQLFEVLVCRQGVPLTSLRAAMPSPATAAEAAKYVRTNAGAHEVDDTYQAVPFGMTDDDALALAVESMCDLMPGFAARVADVIAGTCHTAQVGPV